jgi:hypothetical protein
MNSKQHYTEDQLVEAIHDLPKSKTPPGDPWPGIAAVFSAASGQERASGRGMRWGHQALAASVAVAFVAGLMFGQQIGTEPAIPMGANSIDLAMQAALEANEREYQAAFREFIPVGMSKSLLATEAVENIESSWAEMQQAERALVDALKDYPDNHYLNQKLLDLRSQQLGFMRQLATLDQFSRRKI